MDNFPSKSAQSSNDTRNPKWRNIGRSKWRPHYANKIFFNRYPQFSYGRGQFPDKRRSYGRRPLKNKETLKSPPRPASPFHGTEEHTSKVIKETSNMIMQQILSPRQETPTSTQAKKPVPDQVQEKSPEREVQKRPVQKHPKSLTKPLNIEEIHEQIIFHITNMSEGRKKNLICSKSSGYDSVIQEIQKQKRLALSKALRTICCNQDSQSSDIIKAIIPDFAININELPLDMIRELSTTLSGDKPTEEPLNVQIKQESPSEILILNGTIINDQAEMHYEPQIKREPPEENDATIQNHQSMCSVRTGIMNDQTEMHYEYLQPQIKEEPPEVNDATIENQSMCSVGTETELKLNSTSSTQTERVDIFLHREKPQTLNEAIESMLEIDNYIAKLTQERQSIFLHLSEMQQQTETNSYKKELDFGGIHEKILVIKVVKEVVLAASNNGTLYFLKPQTNSITHRMSVSQLPITAICDWHNLLFIGSFEKMLKVYDFKSKQLIKTVSINYGVQCMELQWEYIFIGTINGYLLRYNLLRDKIEFEDQISQNAVLVLRAAKEGARRVLLVGTRLAPVCIRDAISGLHMRTMDGLVSPTVYSLLLENNSVYCGTTSDDILQFNFHTGDFLHKYSMGQSKVIGCMKAVGNLLFASCHNGTIYVYNTKLNKFVGDIDGPGGMILSMEIFENLVIVGTITLKFKAILIPKYILQHNIVEETKN